MTPVPFLTAGLILVGLILAGGSARAAIYVSGQVRTEDHVPVADAHVLLSQPGHPEPEAQTETLPNGTFILKAPAPGSFQLSVAHREYVSEDREVKITPRGLTGLQMIVMPRPVLHLKLVGPDRKPVTTGQVEAAVHVSWDGGDTQANTASPATQDGQVDLLLEKPLPKAALDTIFITARDPAVGVGYVYLDKWPETPVDLPLEAGGTITGSAVSAAGGPIPNAPVIAVRMFSDGRFVTPEQHAVAVTGVDGKFDLPALAYGTYLVFVQLPEQKGDPTNPRLVIVSKPRLEITLKGR